MTGACLCVSPALQPLLAFERQAATHAANSCPDVAVNGPYQTDDTAREMADILHQVIQGQLLDEIKASPVISIAVDESTDKAKSHNLAIYVGFLDAAFNPQFKLMRLVGTGGHGDAETLYNLVKTFLEVRMDPSPMLPWFTFGGYPCVGSAGVA